jgi:hypothetical protein
VCSAVDCVRMSQRDARKWLGVAAVVVVLVGAGAFVVGRSTKGPPEHGQRIERMEAVRYPLDGGGYSGKVLWIQC